MITRALHLNLSGQHDEGLKRYVWGGISDLPDGARVVLYVGDRSDYDYETAMLLGQFVSKLHFEVQGTTVYAIDSWAAAIAAEGPPRGWSS